MLIRLSHSRILWLASFPTSFANTSGAGEYAQAKPIRTQSAQAPPDLALFLPKQCRILHLPTRPRNSISMLSGYLFLCLFGHSNAPRHTGPQTQLISGSEEHTMKLRTKVLALALSIIGASTAFADTVVLNFDGIATTYPFDSSSTFIENFYNGGTSSVGTTGPNYGITFTPNALAICLNPPGVAC